MQQPTLDFHLLWQPWVKNQNGVSFTCSPVEIISRAIPAEGSMAGLFQFGSFRSFTPNVHASIKKPSVAVCGQALASRLRPFHNRSSGKGDHGLILSVCKSDQYAFQLFSPYPCRALTPSVRSSFSITVQCACGGFGDSVLTL